MNDDYDWGPMIVLFVLVVCLWTLWNITRASERDYTAMRHWILVKTTFVLDSDKLVSVTPQGEYDTLADCSKAQAGRVEKPIEGKLSVWSCLHDTREISM